MEKVKRMKEKGWAKHELKHLHNILKDADLKKRFIHKFFDSVIFWFFLLLLTIGNFFMIVSLFPVLFSRSIGIGTFLILFIAFMFGIVLTIIVHSFDFSRKHHFFTLFSMLISSIIFVLITNHYVEVILGILYKSILSLVVSYILAFLLPYFIYRLYLRFLSVSH
jgi:hypothetical protein